MSPQQHLKRGLELRGIAGCTAYKMGLHASLEEDGTRRGVGKGGTDDRRIGRDQKIAQHTVHEAERRKIQQEEMDLFRGDRRIQGYRWTAGAFLVLRRYWD